VQAWADSVDFQNKKVRVGEAVVDPRQGLGLTAGSSKSENDKESDEGEQALQNQRKKGKMFDLSYDKLVIGVGCYLQTFGTPGVKEHAYFLKDVGDARKIRRRLLECFEMASLPTVTEKVKDQLMTFAIVGYAYAQFIIVVGNQELTTNSAYQRRPNWRRICRRAPRHRLPRPALSLPRNLQKSSHHRLRRSTKSALNVRCKAR